jgi:hypothetical protein
MQKTPRKNHGRAAKKKAPLPMASALIDATRIPDVVRIPRRTVVACDGEGPPEKEAFQRGVAAVYGAAYGLKFAQKERGRDFRIGPLEARWWAEPPPQHAPPPRETWRWQVRIALPDGITEEDVAAAAAKKHSAARRIVIEPQTLGRILHVGPYADEPRSLEAARAALVDAGLVPAGPHVEVYLSDPRRTAQENLRTVLLVESAH